ncbi:MAG: hypothetical protein JSV74_01305 [Dehalococcoidia bacterium]|nr:MAG: hypothetical protein JSV74_01305 [Dehalococcoidia bacterium]
MRFLKLVMLIFILSINIACNFESNTDYINENTELANSDYNTGTKLTLTPTYSKYTVLTNLGEEFDIIIGAADTDHNWVPFFDNTSFALLGESVFQVNQNAEINPFNNSGSEIFTFQSLKTGKTQIILVHRPVIDQGSIDPEEMSLWQELFPIIVN